MASDQDLPDSPPAPEPDETPKATALGGWLGLGDLLAKAAGVVAVLGYVSARWHMSLLGISALTPLSVHAYLAETLLFIVQTLWRVVPYAALAVILWWVGQGLLRVLRWLGHRISAERREALQRSFGNLRSRLSRFAAWSTLVLIVATDVWLVHWASDPGGLLVGDLTDQLEKYLERRSTLGWAYDILVVAVLLLAMIRSRWLRGTVDFDGQTTDSGPSPNATVWRLAHLAFVLAVVTIPMLFGLYVRPASYPLAAYVEKSGTSRGVVRCGVLMAEHGENVVFWQPEGHASMTRVSTKNLSVMVTADVVSVLDVRKDPAGQAAQHMQSQCLQLKKELEEGKK